MGVAGVGTLIGGLLVVTTAGTATADSPTPPVGATIVSNDGGSGACATAAFTSIQAAVDAASAHDTIFVCAGTYDESVSIDKPLILDGAEYGVDARGRSAPETVIDSSGGIAYASGASTGTISGFDLTGYSGSGPGEITADPGLAGVGSGWTFTDNIIDTSQGGIGLNTDNVSDPSPTTIAENEFTQSTPASESGDGWEGQAVTIWGDPGDNVTIQNNDFQDLSGPGGAINTSGTGNCDATGSGSSDNLSVTGNSFEENGSGGTDENQVVLFCTIDASITANTVTITDANDPNAESSIYLGGGDVSTNVSGNTLTGDGASGASGINLNSDFYAPGAGMSITSNTVSGFLYGIHVRDGEFGDGGDAWSAPSNFTISGNTVTDSVSDGIDIGSGATGGTISDNSALGSGSNDCEDDTTGTGTANTADTWTGDVGVTNSPGGLCQSPDTVVTAPNDSTIVLGSSTSDTATVTGNSVTGTPTGTVSFAVAGPCTGGVFSGCGPLTFQALTDPATLSGSGTTATAVSPPYTPTAVGLYCFEGVYAGSSSYVAGSDYEAAECFTVTPAGTTTGTGPTSTSFALGGNTTDNLTVTGNAAGGSPTGDVSFYECGPTTLPTPCTSTANAVGGPTALAIGPNDTATATSTAFTPDATGWWCFAGDYAGQANYNSSSDNSTDECFDVTAAGTTTATAPANTTITLGQADNDLATVAGNAAGGSPTGSVTFYECGPTLTPAPCTSTTHQVGSPVTVSAAAANTATATSASFIPTGTGYTCFAAVYSGDNDYVGSSHSATDECVDVVAAGANPVTTPTQTSIVLGQSNTDSVVVTGNATGGSPTGSVSFYECGPTLTAQSCTPGAAHALGGSQTLTPGSDDTATASSPTFTPTGTGEWCFAVSYAGDSNYAAQFQAGTNECFAVTQASTGTVTAPTHGSIVLGSSDTDGVTVTGNATGGSPTGSVSFYECPPASPTSPAAPCTSTAHPVGTAVTLTAGAGHTATATSTSFAPTSAGNWCFAGVYSGDSNYQGSADTTTDECVTVTKATTSTVTAPLNSSVVVGTTNSDKVTVTGNAAGGSPTGTVSFYECGPTSVATACTSTANPVGSPVNVTAAAGNTATATSATFKATSTGYWCFAGVYSGDGNYSSSSDTTVDECYDVTQAPTTTTTTPTHTTVVLGATDTDAVTVTGTTTPGNPTGTVTFYECGPTVAATACTSTSHQVGGVIPLTAGPGATSTATSASFSPTSAGYWCLAGVYSGDSNYSGSTDTTTDECVDVTQATTSTTTVPTTLSISLGTSDTDGATVAGNPAGGSPTGSVSFYECGPTASPTACTSRANPVGAAVTLTAGVADVATATSPNFTPTSSGYWCFAGVYSGDNNYLSSSDGTTDECFHVTPSTSSTVTSPTNLTITLGQADTDLATVTGNAAGGSPTGTVSFYECGPSAAATPCASTTNKVGSAVSLSAGANDTATATSASFTPAATGYTCFMAAYSGDGNYFASSDTTTEECVNVVSSADTVTTSTPATATFVLGGSDSDLATVTGNPAGGSPTGNVLFYECGPTAAATPCTSTAHPVGPATSLVAGPNDTATATSASFTPTGAGFWCFAADYQGGTSYFGSSDTSTTECFDVTPAPSATGSSPGNPTVQLGATTTDNVAVTGNATAGSPTGTVTFYACGPEASPASCTSINDPVGSPVHLTVGANDVSTATSPAFAPTATGTWCFASVYGGSTNYSESVDNSTDECFHVTAGPSATASHPAQGTIVSGNSDSDVVTVTGNAAAGAPTGTVTFYQCGPSAAVSACTSTANQVGSAVTLTAGANNTATATSVSFTPDALGYWCFAARYSGSGQYLASNDETTDECFDVVTTPTALTILTTTLPAGAKGAAYSTTLSATGGLEPYRWSASRLPRGLSVNRLTGVLAGTPKTSGTFTVTIRVKDATKPHHEKASESLKLVIS